MYNMLLDLVINDKETGYSHKYNLGNNIRNEVPRLKQENKFFYQVHASPLKNAAIRLKQALDDFLEGRSFFPKHFCTNDKFFSLLYEDPKNGGIFINGKDIRISLGMAFDDQGKKHYHYIYGKLKQKVIKHNKLCTCRIMRKYGIYYLALVMKIDYTYNYRELLGN